MSGENEDSQDQLTQIKVQENKICDPGLRNVFTFWSITQYPASDYEESKNRCFLDCEHEALKEFSEGILCEDRKHAVDTRGETCEWYDQNPDSCGLFDT